MTGPGRQTVRVRACAKINLTLRVLGIRDDGYHELRTTFQSLALHDTLTFSRAPGPFRIETDDPRCPTDASNLVWKAAERLWAATGHRSSLAGVRVHIEKRIPSEAGLGGGSSDAAAALRALTALWNTTVPEPALLAVARDIGADVPFFLEGGTVLGVERGDLLFPLIDGPSAWVVLARPDFGVGTGEAYGWWDADRGAERGRMVGAAPGVVSDLVNDLEAPVAARHPRIATLARRLRTLGATRAAMSGSGSAVFGLFDDEGAALRAAAAVAGPAASSWVTRTLSRREYQRTVRVSRSASRRAQ